MPASFKVGDKVRQKMPAPLRGVVVAFGSDVGGELGYRITFEEADGGTGERWFPESQLELVPKGIT